jgi:CDP-diacylglycerol--serine O-phosphatidyltransferase
MSGVTLRKGRGKRSMQRGIYLLPSIFTSLSLFCGFYSITSSIKDNFLQAAWLILLAGAFDSIDGRIARIIHSVSRFGEHYDSLVDMISFGIAPGVLVYLWALQPFGRWGWLVTFFYIICVALRLARFNVQSSSLENKYFHGLPSPPSAAMIATTVILFHSLGIGEVKMVAIPLMTCLLALLMVSTIHYQSFKDFDFKRRRPFNVLVALILILILFIGEPEIFLFVGVGIYTLSGPIGYLLVVRKRRIQQARLEDTKTYTTIP